MDNIGERKCSKKEIGIVITETVLVIPPLIMKQPIFKLNKRLIEAFTSSAR